MTRGPAGVMYCSTGEFYVAEAIRAASSSLRVNDVPHVLFADVDVDPPAGMTVSRFEPTGEFFADRIANMRRSPFERTLYLDSDTYVVDDVVHVLALLDHYDFAAAFAPGYRGLHDPEVPWAFHEFNCGVLAWRHSERTDAFMSDWQRTYEGWLVEEDPFPGARAASRGGRADQPAFRHCAWKHGIDVFALPAEYNFRIGFPQTVVGSVHVIHGEHPDPAALAKRLNEHAGPRSWPPPPTLRQRARWRVRRALGRPAHGDGTPNPRSIARDERRAAS
jgi:hypothetical protein